MRARALLGEVHVLASRLRLDRARDPRADAGAPRGLPRDGGRMNGLLHRLAARAAGTAISVRSDARLPFGSIGPAFGETVEVESDAERAAPSVTATAELPGGSDTPLTAPGAPGAQPAPPAFSHRDTRPTPVVPPLDPSDASPSMRTPPRFVDAPADAAPQSRGEALAGAMPARQDHTERVAWAACRAHADSGDGAARTDPDRAVVACRSAAANAGSRSPAAADAGPAGCRAAGPPDGVRLARPRKPPTSRTTSTSTSAASKSPQCTSPPRRVAARSPRHRRCRSTRTLPAATGHEHGPRHRRRYRGPARPAERRARQPQRQRRARQQRHRQHARAGPRRAGQRHRSVADQPLPVPGHAEPGLAQRPPAVARRDRPAAPRQRAAGTGPALPAVGLQRRRPARRDPARLRDAVAARDAGADARRDPHRAEPVARTSARTCRPPCARSSIRGSRTRWS